jgi:hypothetical protein
MKRNLIFVIALLEITSSCASVSKVQSSIPIADEASLLLPIKSYLSNSQTCAMLPADLWGMQPERPKKRVRKHRLKAMLADPKRSPEPFIDAGLIKKNDPPAGDSNPYVYFEYTAFGLTQISEKCRGRIGTHGGYGTTIGFPAFDLEVGKITSTKPPYESGCVWHTFATVEMKVENVASWYDADLFQPFINRKIDPRSNYGRITREMTFHGFGDYWRVGGFDYPHSNLVCLR